MYKITYSYKLNEEILENTIKYNVSEYSNYTVILLNNNIDITFYWDKPVVDTDTKKLFVSTIKKYHKHIKNETISSIRLIKMKDLDDD